MSIAKQLKPYVSVKTYTNFSKLIIRGGSKSYYLLDFNNGQYAAFWRPSIISKSVEEIVNRLEAGELINNEDSTRPFIEGLAYITNVKSDAIDYINSALLHKDLKCKAHLIELNLRRNLGKWST